MQKSREILKSFWGYETFRPLQEDIVDAVINGNDVLAILPTGGGKSICFQVPGIAREGICIVVSPLIALMQDQVNNLNKLGIRAKSITSGMTFREIDLTLDNCRFGGVDFLYVSPERLKTTLFIERLKLMTVGLFVVDEAHCISEWGHDFRPPYMEIAKVRAIHPTVPLMALTATATTKVKQDIISSLELKNPLFFESSFERKNVSYEVYKIDNKDRAIIQLCKKWHEHVGIVYCQTRKSVKEVTQLLIANGIRANMYHGGMESEERAKALQAWMDEKTPVMVATNAFGMGIDKPNVRFVTHYEIPNNPEAYFQEAGRAGRDGQSARTLAFYEEPDLKNLHDRIDREFPSLEDVQLVYRALCNYLRIAIGSGNGETYAIDFSDFSHRFNLDLHKIYASLKLLEINDDLYLNEQSQFHTRLKFTVTNVSLYSFLLAHPEYTKLTNLINRTYSSAFDEFVDIRSTYFAKTLGITVKELEQKLKVLEQHGLADIAWKTDLPRVTFLHERLPNDYISLRAESYFFRKERAYERLSFMLDFVQARTCRPQRLLRYFGQESEECGICDLCKSKGSQDLNSKIRAILENSEISIEEIRSKFDETEKSKLDLVLKKMINEGELLFHNGKLKLK